MYIATDVHICTYYLLTTPTSAGFVCDSHLSIYVGIWTLDLATLSCGSGLLASQTTVLRTSVYGLKLAGGKGS
jgi:hypothetical protein